MARGRSAPHRRRARHGPPARKGVIIEVVRPGCHAGDQRTQAAYPAPQCGLSKQVLSLFKPVPPAGCRLRGGGQTSAKLRRTTPEKYLNFFSPWTADVQGPPLNLSPMIVALIMMMAASTASLPVLPGEPVPQPVPSPGRATPPARTPLPILACPPSGHPARPVFNANNDVFSNPHPPAPFCLKCCNNLYYNNLTKSRINPLTTHPRNNFKFLVLFPRSPKPKSFGPGSIPPLTTFNYCP